MIWLILAVVLLGLLTAIGVVLSGKEAANSEVKEADGCATCNGDNEKCEQTCMMEAAVRDIEYFDDEELDVFKGRPSDSYSETEIDQFRDVVYTMRPEEVAAWCRSITLRGILLPDELKDEIIILRNGDTQL